MKKNKFYNYVLERPAIQAVLLILIITIFAAFLTVYFEASGNPEFTGFGDAVWWVLVTISTVGYGDKVPVTPGGRTMAVVLMFFGVALLSVVTATISSIFVTRKIKEGKGLQEIKLKNHVLLCGWNTQAEQILSVFEQAESKFSNVVMINQLSEEEAADVMARFTRLKIRFVRGDFTRENLLNRANANSASAAIILPDISGGNMRPGDERTILATLSLKTLNNKIKVYAHILDRDNLSHLKKAKADEVVISDNHSGYLLANHVTAPGVPQFFEQLFSETSGYTLKRHTFEPEWQGRRYAEFKEHYASAYNGILLGIGKISDSFHLSDLMSDDYSYLDEFILRKFQEAGRGTDNENRVKIVINPEPETQLQKNDFFISLESEKK